MKHFKTIGTVVLLPLMSFSVLADGEVDEALRKGDYDAIMSILEGDAGKTKMKPPSLRSAPAPAPFVPGAPNVPKPRPKPEPKPEPRVIPQPSPVAADREDEILKALTKKAESAMPKVPSSKVPPKSAPAALVRPVSPPPIVVSPPAVPAPAVPAPAVAKQASRIKNVSGDSFTADEVAKFQQIINQRKVVRKPAPTPPPRVVVVPPTAPVIRPAAPAPATNPTNRSTGNATTPERKGLLDRLFKSRQSVPAPSLNPTEAAPPPGPPVVPTTGGNVSEEDLARELTLAMRQAAGHPAAGQVAQGTSRPAVPSVGTTPSGRGGPLARVAPIDRRSLTSAAKVQDPLTENRAAFDQLLKESMRSTDQLKELALQNGGALVVNFGVKDGEVARMDQGNWAYEGQFKNGVMDGQGTIVYTDGLRYVGAWAKGAMAGYGTLTYPDGSSFKGNWTKGKMEGLGQLTYPDGWQFVGEFKDGKIAGRGTLVAPTTGN